MIATTKSWIANYYEINESQVESFLSDNDVSGFLIMWTTLERDLFGMSFNSSKLKSYATEHKNAAHKLDNEFKHFHDRYQDVDAYRRLIGRTASGPNKPCIAIKNILATTLDMVTDEDKMYLLIYVIFRFRNNIFHGSKGVISWTHYLPQISYCVGIMKCLLDENRSKKSL